MTTAAPDQILDARVAGHEGVPVGGGMRLVDMLVTASAHPSDREWMNLTAGMCSPLAWVEPLSILREIALTAGSISGEEVGLLAAS